MTGRDPRRGEIWLARMDKLRPAVVMHRDFAGRTLNALLVAPLTTTMRDIPTAVRLGPGDGIDRECIASLDNLTLLRRDRLVRPLGQLDADRMAELCRALAIALVRIGGRNFSIEQDDDGGYFLCEILPLESLPGHIRRIVERPVGGVSVELAFSEEADEALTKLAADPRQRPLLVAVSSVLGGLAEDPYRRRNNRKTYLGARRIDVPPPPGCCCGLGTTTSAALLIANLDEMAPSLARGCRDVPEPGAAEEPPDLLGWLDQLAAA